MVNHMIEQREYPKSPSYWCGRCGNPTKMEKGPCLKCRVDELEERLDKLEERLVQLS